MQYAAVASQVDKHNIAIRSAKKSLDLLHEYATQLLQFAKIAKIDDQKCRALYILIKHCEGINKAHLTNIIKLNREILNNLKHSPNQVEGSEKLKKFTIG